MSDLAIVVARLRDDITFADAVRERPQVALRGYRLDDDELRRLEAVMAGTVDLAGLLGGHGGSTA